MGNMPWGLRPRDWGTLGDTSHSLHIPVATGGACVSNGC